MANQILYKIICKDLTVGWNRGLNVYLLRQRLNIVWQAAKKKQEFIYLLNSCLFFIIETAGLEEAPSVNCII